MLIAGDINFALFTNRGYTMHEHIDEMGIINMNGRIYDPLIGRFMSADPYIQSPSDLQSHNRYAYVMNNPLNLTDPSGYNWLRNAWKKVWHSPIFKVVVGIVVAVIAPAFLAYIAPTLFGAGSLATALATGALSGFASTGTLKGAMLGAFTAGLMHGVGTLSANLTDAGVGGFTDGGIGKIALHAGAGCISSVAGGGECKSGALSGELGEFGHNIDVGPSFAAGVTKSAMMGGIGSKIGGGKFADGAITGSFGYLFNFCSHAAQCWNEVQKGIGKLVDLLKPNASQVTTQVGTSAGLWIGQSSSVGYTRDSAGGKACVIEHCLMLGPFAGASADVGVQGSFGTISPTGWSVSGFGKAATPVMGGELTFGYGSDGLVLSASGSRGAIAGTGLKVCTSSVVTSTGITSCK